MARTCSALLALFYDGLLIFKCIFALRLVSLEAQSGIVLVWYLCAFCASVGGTQVEAVDFISSGCSTRVSNQYNVYEGACQGED